MEFFFCTGLSRFKWKMWQDNNLGALLTFSLQHIVCLPPCLSRTVDDQLHTGHFMLVERVLGTTSVQDWVSTFLVMVLKRSIFHQLPEIKTWLFSAKPIILQLQLLWLWLYMTLLPVFKNESLTLAKPPEGKFFNWYRLVCWCQ